MLVIHDECIFLKDAKTWGAIYKVLRFRAYVRSREYTCKADSNMYLTNLEILRAQWASNRNNSPLPVIPFEFLFLQKLLALLDHQSSRELRYRRKHPAEVNELLSLVNCGLLGQSEPWSDLGLFSVMFRALSVIRVKAFSRQ